MFARRSSPRTVESWLENQTHQVWVKSTTSSARIFLKAVIFFLRFQRVRIHTYRIHNVFFPSTRKRFKDAITIASLTGRALYDVRHTSVFVRKCRLCANEG